MVKNMKNESVPANETGSKNTLQNLSGLQLVEFGNSTGFSCDVETGFCGPTIQKEEADK